MKLVKIERQRPKIRVTMISPRRLMPQDSIATLSEEVTSLAQDKRTAIRKPIGTVKPMVVIRERRSRWQKENMGIFLNKNLARYSPFSIMKIKRKKPELIRK